MSMLEFLDMHDNVGNRSPVDSFHIIGHVPHV